MMETMAALKKEKKDPLSLLVRDGKIDQKQAEAIDKIFPPRPPQPRGEKAGPQPPPSFSGGCRPRADFHYKLDILVIAGLITENQAEAILRELFLARADSR
jgi:hypothetical protein